MSTLPGSGYYGQAFAPSNPQSTMAAFGQLPNMAVSNGEQQSGMMEGGQTLDEIINQNNQEMQRRRTFQSYRQPNADNHVRRASIQEFGSPMPSDLADFQFNPDPAAAAMSSQISSISNPQKVTDPRRVRSREDLTLDTRFPQLRSPYASYPATTPYPPAGLVSSGVMSLDPSPQYMPQSMEMPIDFQNPNNSTSVMNVNPAISPQLFFTDSPLEQSFPGTYPSGSQDSAGGTLGAEDQALLDRVSQMGMPETQPTNPPEMNISTSGPAATAQVQDLSAVASPAQFQRPTSRQSPVAEKRAVFTGDDLAMKEAAPPTTQSKYANVYSQSGFDMLNVLMRVTGRPNPEINIGPVDLSCAFVVCDLAMHDLPIVYCSEMFERLTGYTRFEILGRNCRFLQAPDGKVQAGVKRKYVDDSSVLIIKNKIVKRSEVQLSLINYRKGGQPFMNLLTMIPVPWDTDEFRYYVGFQVDLVEQPGSVQAKNPDGSYAINYQRSQFPRYVLNTPDTNTLQADFGQTIGRDEVSTVLRTVASGDTNLSKRIFDKVLLENTDDVVHVLSLKGLFLYLSPASRKVLEYDASELVGTALSSVCHPSDIVPVTRELKESSTGSSVNIVYRIRRKQSGYTWFESHGSLHTEQGKGRKCIILVGRQRPVYAIARSEVASEGGIGEGELWTKMSTTGMFLCVSSNSRTLLDRTPDDLVGTSIQALMRLDSRREFGRILELARTGEKATIRHDIQTRRGQVLQAHTTVYPGDAIKGQKPTFLVAQTKFVKMTRTLLGQKPTTNASPRTDEASIGSATSSMNISAAAKALPSRPSSTPLSSVAVAPDKAFFTHTGRDGLVIGNQDEALASEDNIFDELKTTRSTSWQFELRQMERQNRLLVEELQALLSQKKKRKRRKGMGQVEKDCANCHTRVTPEWRRGPSGNRDLCNGCGLRWAKQVGRVSPRKYSDQGDKQPSSPQQTSPTAAEGPTPAQASGNASGSAAPNDQRSPRSFGSMPSKIDEGQEPPHENVLPV